MSETEILFPYGRCAFASKAGLLPANHLMTIIEGREPPWRRSQRRRRVNEQAAEHSEQAHRR